MPRRLTLLLSVLAMAMVVENHGVIAQSPDCLRDGDSCVASATVICPTTCCSGVPIRINGFSRICPRGPSVLDGSQPEISPSDAELPSFTPSPASSAGSLTFEPTSEPINTQAPQPIDQTTSPPSIPSETPAPTPSLKGVDKYESKTTLSGRQEMSGSTTIVIVIAALACCVVMIGAVLYKRRDHDALPQAPGSAYLGRSSGLTPDNRSLDGVLAGGRMTMDSMKQLPVLSLASRRDVGSFRASSPFGKETARISSPAQRGSSNDDMAFTVDTIRNGSTVQVSRPDTGLVIAKNGVVAL